MNLREMRLSLEDKTSHNPDVRAAREHFARVLQESHAAICGMHEWDFLRHTMPFWQYPDLTMPAFTVGNQSTPTTNVTLTTLSVTGTWWNDLLTENRNHVIERLGQDLLDAEVEATDWKTTTWTGYQNWWDAPFRIEHVEAVGSSTSDPWTVSWSAFLDPRWDPDATASLDVQSAELKWRRRALPLEADRAIRVLNEDGNVVPIVSTAEALSRLGRSTSTSQLDLLDRTGSRVLCFVEETSPEQRFADPMRTFQPLDVIGGGTGKGHLWPESNVERRRVRNHEHHRDLTVAAATDGSGNVATGTYRVFGSWYYNGRFGPPTEISSVTLSGGNDSIDVSWTGYDSDVHRNGRRLSVWVAEDAGEEPFYLAAFAAHSHSTSMSILNLAQATSNVPTSTATTIYPNYLLRWDRTYQPFARYLRPVPRPTSLERFTVEYLVRPAELIHPTDEPDPSWSTFHIAIVHHAAMQLAMKYNSTTMRQHHQAEFRKLLRHMKNRYLPRGVGIKAPIDGGRVLDRFPDGIDWQPT